MTIYALDLDKKGSIDPTMSYYRDGMVYPVHTREDLLKQVPALKKKFPDYKSYAKASIDDVLTQRDKSSAYTLRAFNLASSLLINLGMENWKSRIVEFHHGSDYPSRSTKDILLTGKETRIVVYGSGNIVLLEKSNK